MCLYEQVRKEGKQIRPSNDKQQARIQSTNANKQTYMAFVLTSHILQLHVPNSWINDTKNRQRSSAPATHAVRPHVALGRAPINTAQRFVKQTSHQHSGRDRPKSTSIVNPTTKKDKTTTGQQKARENKTDKTRTKQSCGVGGGPEK